MVMYKRKSWKEKMLDGREPQIKKTVKNFADIPAGSTMLIATPRLVDDYLRHIPKGKTSSIPVMRRDLAAHYGAEYTCPITSGIFLRIVAEAAYEDYRSTKKIRGIAPFWRIVDPKSTFADKLSFGKNFLKKMQRAEHLLWPNKILIRNKKKTS
jgi:hypothetical protein